MFKKPKLQIIDTLIWLQEKQLINRKTNEQGNVLVIAIITGLLALVLVTIALFNSSKARTNTTSEEKADKSSAITAAAFTRTKNFLAKYPSMAQYNSDLWDTLTGTGGLFETVLEGGYKNTSGSSTNCSTTINASNNNSSSDPTIVLANIENRQAIDNNNGFELLGVTLTDSSRQPITPVGTTEEQKIQWLQNWFTTQKANAAVGETIAHVNIQVRGTYNPSAINLNEIFAGNNRSIHQAEIEIPLEKRPPNEIPVPGLWLGEQSTSSWVNPVQADVMINPSDCQNLKLTVDDGYSFIISTATFPKKPVFPNTSDTGVFELTLGGAELTNTGGLVNDLTLPRTSDLNPNIEVYKYVVDKIVENGNDDITIRPGYKVHIYTKGNIELAGQAEITHSCLTSNDCYADWPTTDPYLSFIDDNGNGTFDFTDSDSDGVFDFNDNNGNDVFDHGDVAIDIPVDTLLPNKFDFKNFRIYGYGYNGTRPDALILDDGTPQGFDTTGNMEPLICLKGSGSTHGFIWGAGYMGAVSGGGNNDAFYGAVWLKRWTNNGDGCGSNTNNTVVSQADMTWDRLGIEPAETPAKFKGEETRYRRQENSGS
jgi:hypothetical protein